MLKALIEAADILASRTVAKQDFGIPDFSDKRYAPKPFGASNFRPIEAAQNYFRKISSLRSQLFQPEVEKLPVSRRDDSETSSKIAFVDAGNFEIAGSPNFSVHLIRGYFSVFQNNRRIALAAPSKHEFFSVALATESEKGIAYECAVIPASAESAKFFRQKKFVFDSFDSTLAPRENFRADISVIGSVLRRYLEWSMAEHAIEKELDTGDIALRDGTLESLVSGEAEYSKGAFDAAKKKNVSLCALAKTSALLTTTGVPLVSAVYGLSKQNRISAPWIYNPLCENKNASHDAEISICLLHRNSGRAFRFEMDKSSTKFLQNINSALSQIAANSRDASFLGYPYGLIDADSMSRISFREVENYRAIFNSVLEKKGALQSIQKLSASIDAHDVLNEIII